MRRIIIIILCSAAAVSMMVAAFMQQNQVAALTAKRAQVLARLANASEEPTAVAPTSPPDSIQSPHSPAIEVLRLRAEVARLGNRKRELAGVRVESDRLRDQLAARGTNLPGGLALPAGYLKKSQARFVGYGTPKDTIQSILWALQNRDALRFLQAIGPDDAKQIETQMQSASSTEAFFKESDALPGMHILESEAGDNGEEVLTVETVPGVDSPRQLRFRQFDGQWKLVGGL
jgi:hypothetical protein